MKRYDSPSVKLEGFTPVTYDMLATLVEDWWGHPPLSFARPTVVPLEHAAALYFVLRRLRDDAFPRGKWATIQHLEALIDEAVALNAEAVA